MKKLMITMGLPGSGKTTWAKKYAKNNNAKHFELDKIIENSNYSGDKSEILSKTLKRDLNFEYYSNVILDGPFIYKNDILNILKNINEDNFETEIHYWNEDKEACKWNDKYRRNKNSTFSIEHLKLDDISDINTLLINNGINNNVKIIYHVIKYKSDVNMFCDKYNIIPDDKEDMFINSDTWSAGGRWWSYTGAEGAIEPEQPLEQFTEFDNLLLTICPDISYLKYKKIYSNCITIEQRPINDYYSEGYENYYCCDLNKLVNILQEMNLIEL